MVGKLKDKMGPRGKVIVKLALWSGLLVWMVFFFAFGVVMAGTLSSYGPSIYQGFGSKLFANVLHWVAPIWVVFTSLMICVLVARFAAKRLRSKG